MASSQSGSATNPRLGGYLAPLDGLRGIAILMVLFVHFSLDMNQRSNWHVFGRAVTAFGWTGVDLFFVLSGFLITGILLDSKGATNFFTAFYARRALRIFPIYYLSLAIVFLGTALLPGSPEGYFPQPADRPFYWVYLQNWTTLLKNPTPLVVLHLWSLAVEEQFYLVWPVLVFFFRPRTLLRIAIGGCIAAVVLRFSLVNHGVNSELIYRNTFCRMDALMLGAASAIALRIEPIARFLNERSQMVLSTGIAGLVAFRIAVPAVSYDSKPMQQLGYTIVAASYACMLLFVVLTAGRRTLAERITTSDVLTFFGRYSYGMYLYHLPIYRGIRFIEGVIYPGRRNYGMINVAAALSLTTLASYLSYELFERHFLKLKRYFSPRLQSAHARSCTPEPSTPVLEPEI